MAGHVVEAGDSASLSVSIHPGVLLSISAHYTKAKVQYNTETPRIFGAFVGTQEGRGVEVFAAFECKYDEVPGSLIVDIEFLRAREAQLKQVAQYKDYDFLGWYTVGHEPTDIELGIQRQFAEANENPLFLLVDAKGISEATAGGRVIRELPIFLYESVVRVVDGEPALQFARANFTIATRESERISVDQVARASGGGTTQLEAHMSSLSGAMRMLSERLKVLEKLVDSFESGAEKPDLALLRRIHSLTTQLPAAQTPEFRQDFTTEYSDALLAAYLASLTKSAAALNDTIDKFNLVNESKKTSLRMI